MIDLSRGFKKYLMLTLLFLASFGFVVLGMGNLSFGVQAAKVATVGSVKISQIDWDNAHQMEINRALTDDPDASLSALDTPAMRYATLQRMVHEQVLAMAARKEHLAVSDGQLALALREDPTIATLFNNGKLDMDAYQDLLAAQGLTPAGFEANVRANLSQAQVLGGIVDSAFASPAQANVSMDAWEAQRRVQLKVFKAADYAEDIKASDADLQTFYEAHLNRYQVLESVDIEYITLDLESVKKNIQISDDVLQAYYDQNSRSFGTPEERSASHILISVASDASEKEQQAARDKAEHLLEQLRADPDSFAAMAEAESDDRFSAKKGGDLGSFQENKGIDERISEATFKLAEVGDISDPVRSDFGYHIIRLTGITPAVIPSFEELRPQLEDQFRTQEAQREFTEAAEEFTNGVYEQPDSLKPTADELDLPIQNATGVTEDVAPDAQGPLADAKFLAALFSSDVLDDKNNTEAIEFGTNKLVAGRVVKHIPAHAQALDEIRDTVTEQYKASQGAEEARQAGQAQLATWQKDADDAVQELGDPVTLSRQDRQGYDELLVEAVLRSHPEDLPEFIGVDLGAQGYVIAHVVEALTPDHEQDNVQQQVRLAYEQLWALAEAQSQYEWLSQEYDAKILAPLPSATTGDD